MLTFKPKEAKLYCTSRNIGLKNDPHKMKDTLGYIKGG